MNPPPSADSPRRRKLVAGLGAGVCAIVAGSYGWFKARPAATTVLKPAGSHAAPASAAASAESSSPHPTANPEVLTRAWFEPYLNTEFHLKVSALTAASMKLTQLSEAKVVTDKKKGINYTSYSLVFTGSKNLPEESKVYRVDHGVLGGMELFLSPVGHYEDQVRLEAVFTQRS